MHIAVLVKQVPDTEGVRINPKTREPDASGAGLLISLYDKNAVEAGVQLKAQAKGKVVAVSLGGDRLDETLREVLAMGADEAIALKGAQFQGLDKLGKAKALAGAVKATPEVKLVIAAEESADSHTASTGPMVAELLGWPLLSYVFKIELKGETVRVERETDEGIEVLEAPLPAVVTVVESINEPRLPALMQILQAKNKPIKALAPQDVGAAGLAAHTQLVSNVAPESSRKREIVEAPDAEKAADWLVERLRKEGVI